MLTDNFPFKAYSGKDQVFSSESVQLSGQAFRVVNNLMTDEGVSPDSVAGALLSVYLYLYMNDDVISTISFSEEKLHRIDVSVRPEQTIRDVISAYHSQSEVSGQYFPDEDFIFIKTSSFPEESRQEVSGDYQILIDVLINPDASGMKISYRNSALIQGAAQLMIHQLSHMLNNLEGILDGRISSVTLLTPEVRDKILNDFGVQHRTFNYDYGIYQRFRNQVTLNPDGIAIVFSEKRITYRKLHESVNRLSYLMHTEGACKGSRIGVFLNRSDYSVVSILAILKLGGCYIPLDSTYPAQYIDNIQKETRFSFMLSETSLIDSVKDIECRIINVRDADQNEDIINTDIPEVLPDPLDEFAILYTSGTTGKPKGAVYNHASPLNKSCWMWEFFDFSESDVFLQRTSVNFSPSLWEMFGALLTGRKTVIVPDEVVRDPDKLIEVIKNEDVTFMGVVPALLRMMFESGRQDLSGLESLRYISCSGEPMQIDLYRRIKESLPDVRLFNDYGSTEMNAVGYSEITDESTQSQNFPIGKPLSNVYYYILDDDLRLVPPFMTGNLYVGGISLLNEYVCGAEAPFIKDPVLNSGIRYFKSGDKARFLADGKIELVGRDDFIVKIRGMRVSLYQVETVIKSHSRVDDACVVSRKRNDGENEIVAYLNTSDSVTEIRDYCRSALPEYMVPSRLIAYGILPKKTNGKLDRKYLADLATKEIHHEGIDVTNSDDVDITLREIIKAVFSDNNVNSDVPFPSLGMTSMDAVMITAEINRIWSLAISVTDMLQFDTVSRLSDYVESVMKGSPIQADMKEYLYQEADIYRRAYRLPETSRSVSEKNMLITGANGYLGSGLIASALKHTEAVLYCLVRGNTRDQAEKKLMRSLIHFGVGVDDIKNRVHIVCSAISEDNLGLEKDVYDDLAGRIDTVFHLAADTNHFSDYSTLKNANVLSTRNVIDFCFSRKAKSLIFSSSVSVILKKSGGQYYTESGETLVSPDGLYNGYGKTKWVSEQLIDNARKNGLNTAVVRFGELSFHSESGYCREDDIFHSCLRLMSDLRVMPEWKDGFINCLAVDKASDSLIDISRYIADQPESECIYNMVARESLRVDDIVSYDEITGFEEWLALCRKHIAENESVYPTAFISFFDNGNNALIREYFKEIRPDMDAYDDIEERINSGVMKVPVTRIREYLS